MQTFTDKIIQSVDRDFRLPLPIAVPQGGGFKFDVTYIAPDGTETPIDAIKITLTTPVAEGKVVRGVISASFAEMAAFTTNEIPLPASPQE